MALKKVTYTDKKVIISAQNLNDIQDAIIKLEGREDSPEGPGGNDCKDVGYYTPNVEQVDNDTIKFSFFPSNNELPTVPDVSVTLPSGYNDVTEDYEKALASGEVSCAKEYLWTLGVGKWFLAVRDENGNELERFYVHAFLGEASNGKGLIYRILIRAQDFFDIELHNDDKYNSVPAIMLEGETGNIYSNGKEIGNGGSSGGNVDLTGYATESFVEGYVDRAIQNMGEIGGFATEHFVEGKISGLAVEKTEDMTQPVGIDANGNLWVAPGAAGKDGHTPVKGVDYFIDSDKAEIVDAVKVAVPLVKVAEQPTHVNSVDEMTDTSKVYVMPDMSMWAYMEDYFSHTYTADDFVADALNTNGALLGNGTPNRIATASMIDLSKGTVSVYCPAPYQYIVYYYTDRAASAYIGKTTFRTGNIDDVLKDTVASGTLDGAMYCRISLRDGESTTVDLSGRVDEFLSKVAITQKGNTKEYAWKNTGFSYNQPSAYEDRIVALERALEGIEHGSF